MDPAKDGPRCRCGHTEFWHDGEGEQPKGSCDGPTSLSGVDRCRCKEWKPV